MREESRPRSRLRFPRAATLRAALCLVALLLAPRVPAQTAAGAAGQGDRSALLLGQAPERGKLTAYFFKLSLAQDTGADEKSGDSSLLVSPEGRTMLVDGGSPECFSQVSGYLEALGVKRLDYVVATHPHVDHVGALAGILASFPVGVLYTGELGYPTATYAALLTAAKKSGTPIVRLKEGDEIGFGEAVKVEVLNPEPDIVYYEGYPANSTQFVNNHSLVLKFVYGKASMLFMGDVYSPREAELLQKYGGRLGAQVLKLGHHGSDTSSSKSFIKAVSPAVAVAMHDRLASLQVYKNLRKLGTLVYLTAIDGCVRVSSGPEGIWTALTQFDRLSDFLN